MDWNLLNVALAISRAGSLTRAATLLGIDQTTAGRRLSLLEEQVQQPLFRRSKSGFISTEAGEVVIAHARKVEEQINAMTDELDRPAGTISGTVRLLANNWMLELLAEHVFPEVLARHPGLELRLSGRLPPAPLHGEATMSLWFDAAPQASEIAIPFCRVPYDTYEPATAKVPSDEIVFFMDDDAEGPSFTRQLKKRLGTNAQFRLSATDAHILRAAVRGGAGQGVLPVAVGEADTSLRKVDGRASGLHRVLHLHLHPSTARTRRVRAVLDAISAELPERLRGTFLAKRNKRLIDLGLVGQPRRTRAQT